METVRIEKGQVIIRYKEQNDYCYFIKEGIVELCVNLPNRPEKFVQIGQLKANDCVGEISFIDRHPSALTAITKTDCVFLKLTLDDIKNHDKESVAAMGFLLKYVCRKLREQIRI